MQSKYNNFSFGSTFSILTMHVFMKSSLFLVLVNTHNNHFYMKLSMPRWRRGSWLDCGSGDLGSIPGIPLPRVGPLMARRLKTSFSDVTVPVLGLDWHAKDP